MEAIVAYHRNTYGIGKEDKIVWDCPEDLQHYKKMTLGKTCIVGRKTFDSLPPAAKRGRDFIIITRDENKLGSGISIEGSHTRQYADLGLMKQHIKNFNRTEQFIVIGGADIYKLLREYIEVWYVTVIEDNSLTSDDFDTFLDMDLLDGLPTLAAERLTDNTFTYTLEATL